MFKCSGNVQEEEEEGKEKEREEEKEGKKEQEECQPRARQNHAGKRRCLAGLAGDNLV